MMMIRSQFGSRAILALKGRALLIGARPPLTRRPGHSASQATSNETTRRVPTAVSPHLSSLVWCSYMEQKRPNEKVTHGKEKLAISGHRTPESSAFASCGASVAGDDDNIDVTGTATFIMDEEAKAHLKQHTSELKADFERAALHKQTDLKAEFEETAKEKLEELSENGRDAPEADRRPQNRVRRAAPRPQDPAGQIGSGESGALGGDQGAQVAPRGGGVCGADTGQNRIQVRPRREPISGASGSALAFRTRSSRSGDRDSLRERQHRQRLVHDQAWPPPDASPLPAVQWRSRAGLAADWLPPHLPPKRRRHLERNLREGQERPGGSFDPWQRQKRTAHA